LGIEIEILPLAARPYSFCRRTSFRFEEAFPVAVDIVNDLGVTTSCFVVESSFMSKIVCCCFFRCVLR